MSARLLIMPNVTGATDLTIGPFLTKVRSECWFGGIIAISTLVLLVTQVQTGVMALVCLAALVALKEMVWDFLLLDAEAHQIGGSTWRAALAFSMTYLTGMILTAL